MDKNVKFNNINYDIQFLFTEFFKKQIKKARFYVIKIFGVNIICQIVKIKTEIKFNKIIKAYLAIFKPNVEYIFFSRDFY